MKSDDVVDVDAVVESSETTNQVSEQPRFCSRQRHPGTLLNLWRCGDLVQFALVAADTPYPNAVVGSEVASVGCKVGFDGTIIVPDSSSKKKKKKPHFSR
jgi:hypothetical protein